MPEPSLAWQQPHELLPRARGRLEQRRVDELALVGEHCATSSATPSLAFFAGLELPGDDDTLNDSDKRRLVELADIVTLARSPVERDTYKTREIELVPDAEAPARFVNVLASSFEPFGPSDPTEGRNRMAFQFRLEHEDGTPAHPRRSPHSYPSRTQGLFWSFGG
jgi:hypothetical protein